MSYATFRRSHPLDDCPLNAALETIGGRWKVKVISWLAEYPHHYAALCEHLPDISRKVLTQQLRELVSDGIVRREVTGAVPAPVRYSLTDHGRTLLPVLACIKDWGVAHARQFPG